MSKPVRPEWLYGPETPKNIRTRYILSGIVVAIAALCLVILTGCKSSGEPTPSPVTAATTVKAPNVPETIGTSYSVTEYPMGTVVPLDASKLPSVDCWYEVSAMDDDHQPGGSKHIEVRAICP